MKDRRVIGGAVVGIFVGLWLALSPLHAVSAYGFHVTATPPFIIRNIAPGIPTTLIIPALSIHQPIEQVGFDKEKRMDVPKNVYNAGWYMFGARPGDKGNAVIDGHINTPKLAPSIFYNLDTLRPGDSVIIEDDKGQTLSFHVTHVEHIPLDNFPIKTIFGSSNKTNLNLITCSGSYDRKLKNYTERVVVFTELTS